MQLTLALAPGFRRIDSRVLQAIFPALAELIVKNQSYGTLLALDLCTPLASLLHVLWSLRHDFVVLS